MRRLGIVVGLFAWLLLATGWAATLEVDSVEARRGEAVEVSIVLHTDGDDVAGTENVIGFEEGVSPLDCWRNPALDREATFFSFWPSFCRPGVDCNSLKALVFSFSNLDPLPDDATLYTCSIRVSPEADATEHLLDCRDAGGSTPEGEPIETGCVDGVVVVPDSPAVPTVAITARPTSTYPGAPTPTVTPTPNGLRSVSIGLPSRFVSADRGGQVEIVATVFDSNRVPENGVAIDFDRDPAVGNLVPNTVTSAAFEVGLVVRNGIGRTVFSVEPGSPVGDVTITAVVDGGVGRAVVTLFSGDSPPVTPTPTPAQVSSVAAIYMETVPYAINTEVGGPVVVRAFAFDANNEPVNDASLLFDFAPKVGTLHTISERTRTVVDAGGRAIHGVAEAVIEVQPGVSQPGFVTVTAETPGVFADTKFALVPGAPGLVQSVVLEVISPDCGRQETDPIAMRATVFDDRDRRLDGIDVVFTADERAGRFMPLIVETATIQSQSGVADTMLLVPPGLPIPRDPETGVVLPYNFRARAGGVEGTAQVFLVGREICDSAGPTPTVGAFSGDSDDGCGIGRVGDEPDRGPLMSVLLLAALGLYRRRKPE